MAQWTQGWNKDTPFCRYCVVSLEARPGTIVIQTQNVQILTPFLEMTFESIWVFLTPYTPLLMRFFQYRCRYLSYHQSVSTNVVKRYRNTLLHTQTIMGVIQRGGSKRVRSCPYPLFVSASLFILHNNMTNTPLYYMHLANYEMKKKKIFIAFEKPVLGSLLN